MHDVMRVVKPCASSPRHKALTSCDDAVHLSVRLFVRTSVATAVYSGSPIA